jgi:predicted porin
MKNYTLSALAAAGLLVGGLSVTSASAADLGGNCCADLEERIAELEATTARKGNRKVSLTISGWVGEQVMWWDDGVESNTYVGGLGTTIGTNVKFTGQATISPGWSAGYVIHIEADGNDGLGGWNQGDPNAGGLLTSDDADERNTNYVQTLQSFWFVKSEHLGKVSVGLQSQASDNTAILVDGSGSLIPANFVQFDYGSFFANPRDGSDVTWSALGGCTDCNGVPLNSVRYDTPTFAGFSASASWGPSDFWDVAIRYAGEFSGFKLAAAAAYSESSDSNNVTFSQAPGSQFFQVGAYAQHVPTGLFLYGAYGQLEFDDSSTDGNDFWYVKAGIRQRWHPLGHTVLYGEYQDNQNDAFDVANGLSSEVQLWGVGVVQEIDNAAMSIWVKYRNIEGDISDNSVEIDDFQYVSFGALINF